MEFPLELAAGADPFARESIEHLVRRYGSPLFIIDAERIRAQYRRLAAALPGVDLHYALKPLPHESVVRTLCDEGACFDLATSGEVALVRRSGVPPQRCIHTHPIKRDSDIRNALSFGIDRFVIDNPEELRKFVKYRRRVSLLVRVSFRSPDAVCDLSKKFGCTPAAVPELLGLAAQLRIPVAGLSFHVGSQAINPGMHVHAIQVCGEIIRTAREAGHELNLLDIGGGFPVVAPGAAALDGGAAPGGGVACGVEFAIEAYCAPIVAALHALPGEVRVIAEPGRFIAAPAAVAVSTVMGCALRDGRWWYYLDDGVYGSFSGQVYDHASYVVEAVGASGEAEPSVLAGPTCDSIDVIAENVMLPRLRIGDLIVGRDMGAYTWASASDFNFFPRATVLALDRGRAFGDGRFQ